MRRHPVTHLAALVLAASAALAGPAYSTFTVNAAFDFPDPACSNVPPAPGEVYAYCSTGTGQPNFNWGVAGGEFLTENRLQFMNREYSPAPAVGDLFTIGYLFYRNGTILGGTEVSSINLRLDAYQLDFDNDDTFLGSSGFGSIDLVIRIINTPNTGATPEGAADFIYFPDYPQYGSFRVYEENETLVELIFQRGSLIFQGLGNVADSSGGFTSQSITPFALVPEPATMGLAGVALIALALLRRR
jgi:hypothetical protein